MNSTISPSINGWRSNFLFISPKIILIKFLESSSREELKSVVKTKKTNRESGQRAHAIFEMVADPSGPAISDSTRGVTFYKLAF